MLLSGPSLRFGRKTSPFTRCLLKRARRSPLRTRLSPALRMWPSCLDDAESRLRGMGYKPYYLYRQKFMSGGFENVGWSLTEPSLYNILIMEELTTILALGRWRPSLSLWAIRAALSVSST